MRQKSHEKSREKLKNLHSFLENWLLICVLYLFIPAVRINVQFNLYLAICRAVPQKNSHTQLTLGFFYARLRDRIKIEIKSDRKKKEFRKRMQASSRVKWPNTLWGYKQKKNVVQIFSTDETPKKKGKFERETFFRMNICTLKSYFSLRSVAFFHSCARKKNGWEA